MSETTCKQSPLDHQRDISHEQKEMPSSPKAPPRQNKPQNVCSDADEEKEKEKVINSTEGVQRAKLNPRPRLPPRPTGLSPVHTPPKKSPNTPTQPPPPRTKDPPHTKGPLHTTKDPPHTNDPPQKPDHPKTNETPSSPRPSRPPQPSRQASIKTTNPAPGKPKPPEMKRTPKIVEQKTDDKISKNESYIDSSQNNTEPVPHKKATPGKPQRPPEPSSAGNMTKKEPNKNHEHQTPAQDSMPEAEVPDQKKLIRPPRPIVPPVHHPTIQSDETAMPDSQKSLEKKRSPKPNRSSLRESQVHSHVTQQLEKLSDEGKPSQLPDVAQPSQLSNPRQLTDTQEHGKGKSPKLSRHPKPTRPGSVSEAHASPAHNDAKKEEGQKLPQTTDEKSKSPKLGRPLKPGRPGSEVHASPVHSEAKREDVEKLPQATDTQELETSKSPKLGRHSKPGRPGSEVHASPARSEAKKEDVEKLPQATDTQELETSKSPKLGRPAKPTRPGSVSEAHASPVHSEAKKEEGEKLPQATDEHETSKIPKSTRPPKPTRPGSVSEAYTNSAHSKAMKEEVEKPPKARDEKSKSPKLGRRPKPGRPGSFSKVHASPAHSEAKKEEVEKPPQARDEKSKSPKLSRPPKPGRPGSEVHASPVHSEAMKEEGEKPPQATDELETSKSPKLGGRPKPGRPGGEVHASPAHSEAKKEDVEDLPQATDTQELETSKSPKLGRPPKPIRPGSVRDLHASPAHSEAKKEDVEKPPQATDKLETSKSPKLGKLPRPGRPGSEAHAISVHNEAKKGEGEKLPQTTDEKSKSSKLGRPPKPASPAHSETKKEEVDNLPQATEEQETSKSSKSSRPPKPIRTGSVREAYASPAHSEATKKEGEKLPQATDELETSKTPKSTRPAKPTRPGSVSEARASPVHSEAKKEEGEKPPQATDELETSKSPKSTRPPKPTRPGSVSEAHASSAQSEAKKEDVEKLPQATDELETSKSLKSTRPPKPTRPGSISEAHASPVHSEAKKEEVEKPPQATDTQELQTSKSPKLNRSPKPTRPAHSEAKKDDGEKAQKHKPHNEKPSRPSLPKERAGSLHAAQPVKDPYQETCKPPKPCELPEPCRPPEPFKTPETCKSPETSKSPETPKSSKFVRPPPPNRPVYFKKIEKSDSYDSKKENTSSKEQKKTDGSIKEDNSNKPETGEKRQSVLFRVSSFSKTEVESFNKETSFGKPKQDAGNRVRASSKEDKKPGKRRPPVLPKPPRQRPQQPQLKKADDKNEPERESKEKEKEKEHGDMDEGGVAVVRVANEDRGVESLKDKNVDTLLEKETATGKKKIKKQAPGIPEAAKKECSTHTTKEKAISVPDHKLSTSTDKERTVGIAGERTRSDNLKSETLSTEVNIGKSKECDKSTRDLGCVSDKQSTKDRKRVSLETSEVEETKIASEVSSISETTPAQRDRKNTKLEGDIEEKQKTLLENEGTRGQGNLHKSGVDEKKEDKMKLNTENYLTSEEIVVKDENQETMKDNVEKHLTTEENVSEKVNESRNDEFEGERTDLIKEECLTDQKLELHGKDRKEDGLNVDVKQDLRVEKHEENTKGGINTSLDEKHIAEKKITINVMDNELQAKEVNSASCSEDLGVLSKPSDGVIDVKETKKVETSEEKSSKEIIPKIQESPDLLKETETGEDRNERKESEEESTCVEVNVKMEKTQNATVCVKDAEDLDKKTVVLDDQAVKSEEIKKGGSSGDVEGSVNLEVSLGDTEGSVMVDKNTGVARGQDGNSGDTVGKTQTADNSEVIVRAQEVSVSESVPPNDEPTSTPCEDTGVSREDTSASRESIVKEERKSSECFDSHVAATSESTILVAQQISVEASAEKNLVPTDKPSVQSSKRKPPPPKPKRTSSLKRESRPLIEKTNDSKDQLNEITEEKRAEKPTRDNADNSHVTSGASTVESNTAPQMSPPSHTEPQVSPTSHTDSQVPPTRNVVFHVDVMKLKESSSSVSRSKSFSSTAKGRTKNGPSSKPETGTKENSGAEGGALSRSYSFGGILRKRAQPPKPSPPTFFVEPSITSEDDRKEDDRKEDEGKEDEGKEDEGKEDEGKEDEGKEDEGKEDVGENTADDQGKSDSIEELEKIDKPVKDDSKHDSLTLDNTTDDTESESEKEDLPQKSKTYYISREILSTERTFVDVMKLVSEDFMEALKKGNKKFGRPIIPEETLHDIVLNITQMYDFDREFLKALENRMETWDDQQRIGDIIKKFSPFLKMYKTYIQGYDNAMAVLTEALKKYPQFAEVVREFECSERCQNLTVGMYMLKPIQRIPSYRLLLKDYLKHLSKESLDYKDVSDALAIVSDVATHINEDMKRVDNFEEVLKVQRSLVGQVEIVKPGRDLIKEGALMKLCRKDMQPRMFFLFTDVLLYTTPVANNQYRLNLSLPLGEIKVEIPASPEFDNEFSIISTKKSFTLSASTAEERDEWLEALRNASDEIRKKKITFRLAQKEKMEVLADTPQDGEDKNAKLGSKAPVWIPDARVTMCMLCTDDFTVTNRRHHCRACGKVVCGSCSSNSTPLPYLNHETARVCDYCYDELTVTSPVSSLTSNASENGDTAEQNDSSSKNSPVQKQPPPEVAPRGKKVKNKSKEVPAVEESTISGYLRTRVGKKWHKRWYVVKDNVLYTSKASSDVAAQETCPLLGYDVRGPEKMDGDSKKIVFQLIHAGTQPVVLQTDNMKSAERWVNALRRATILPL